MQVLNRRPPKAQEVATPFHMRGCENFRPKSSEKAWRQTINLSKRTAEWKGTVCNRTDANPCANRADRYTV